MDMMRGVWSILIFYSSAHIPKELRVWCLSCSWWMPPHFSSHLIKTVAWLDFPLLTKKAVWEDVNLHCRAPSCSHPTATERCALSREVILSPSWNTLGVSGLKDQPEHERRLGYSILQSSSSPTRVKSRFLYGLLDLKLTIFAILWVKEILCPVS